ncbi:hypothetical protein [Thalassobacillus devorans]|uniref:hypothetical protein n=1 Tax=Thalassobacillus devorans TaxID=279813 RepID=UPI000A1CCE32|nr:hypothetical protein [Thalassobacillus devorans]
MNKFQRQAVVFSLLGAACIAGGMGMKDYIPYSPLIGWLFGLICQILALLSAIKWNREQRGPTN